jgi:hypothetical protein
MADTENAALMRETDRWAELGKTYLAYSKDYGLNTARTVVVLNSGAVVATFNVLAQIEKSNSNIDMEKLGLSANWFIAGIVAGVLSSACGYFNFSSLANKMPGPNELRAYEERGDVSGWGKSSFLNSVNATYVLGILSVSFSICFLVIGSLTVTSSLTK